MDSSTIIMIASLLAILFGVLFVVFVTDLIWTKKPKENSASNLLGRVSERNLPERQLAYAEHISPFWPRQLVDLFIRPKNFFASELALGKTPSLILVTWCYGIAVTIDQAHRDLVRATKSPGQTRWKNSRNYDRKLVGRIVALAPHYWRYLSVCSVVVGRMVVQRATAMVGCQGIVGQECPSFVCIFFFRRIGTDHSSGAVLDSDRTELPSRWGFGVTH
jgi:hypothetical protein